MTQARQRAGTVMVQPQRSLEGGDQGGPLVVFGERAVAIEEKVRSTTPFCHGEPTWVGWKLTPRARQAARKLAD